MYYLYGLKSLISITVGQRPTENVHISQNCLKGRTKTGKYCLSGRLLLAYAHRRSLTYGYGDVAFQAKLPWSGLKLGRTSSIHILLIYCYNVKKSLSFNFCSLR